MSFRPTLTLAVACVFDLAGLPIAMGRASAQDFVPQAAPNGPVGHHGFGLRWGRATQFRHFCLIRSVL